MPKALEEIAKSAYGGVFIILTDEPLNTLKSWLGPKG
jgi:hypothetical protein